MKAHLLLAAALAAAVLSPTAAAAPGLILGVDDDSLNWYAHTGSLLSIYGDLALGAVRVNVAWSPGESFPTGTARTELARVGAASRRIRVVLAVTGPATAPPVDAAGRASYCGFAANVVRVYPSIRDVAIWTEPNSATFWKPQQGAPAAYEALLATCWDALHAVAPGVNVIATSSGHVKPAKWFAGLGAAYLASGRTRPILDTFGPNVYPQTSAEPPDATHAKGPIDEGDLDRLLAALKSAFGGTAQPLPGEDGVSVWYMEDGFQTVPGGGRSLYSGVETDREPVTEDEEAAQLTAAVDLAYCQPDVGALFNFELRDDSSLSGWQSGLLRPDWSAKPAFVAYLQAVAAAREGAIACAPR
ncbi:MAG TPA: hypothetical protein VLW05_09035 [Gaiellaceae bacterium]|nr:hypothetical protein [Gaiellaceae bacterium]